jgi:long-chain acyl-CoA synthetase
MKGYYLDPEKTAEVFEDDWYCTGDSGKFDEEGNLWVTGRVSEVFKTSKGKFIVPTRLEDHFGRSDKLAQFCVMGHGLDAPILLTTLSETGKKTDPAALKAELEQLLDDVNADVPAYERVGQIYVVPEWTIENALLTPTMKLKRNQIANTYMEHIQQNLKGERVNIL